MNIQINQAKLIHGPTFPCGTIFKVFNGFAQPAQTVVVVGRSNDPAQKMAIPLNGDLRYSVVNLGDLHGIPVPVKSLELDVPDVTSGNGFDQGQIGITAECAWLVCMSGNRITKTPYFLNLQNWLVHSEPNLARVEWFSDWTLLDRRNEKTEIVVKHIAIAQH